MDIVLRERSNTKFELDVLFEEVLNLDQIKYISRILELLGAYMFLEYSMLLELYQKKYKEKLGLSYITKAVKLHLIVCSKEATTEGEKEIYYYYLKRNAYFALDSANVSYFKVKYFLLQEDREKILTYNKFLIKNNMRPNLQAPPYSSLSFFFAKDNNKKDYICYFVQYTSIEKILNLIVAEEEDKKKAEEQFEFLQIDLEMEKIGNKTKGVDPNDL